MNTEEIPEKQLLDVVTNEVSKIISARRGTGASVDDSCRLGAIHSLLAPMTEKMLISIVYGKENRDWFDAGRKYHKNDTICEQRIRLAAQGNPKPDWAQPGQTYSMFFDISELTHEAPLPDTVKQLLMKGALQMPLPDTTLVSRFPLIEVRAKNAVEAARVIRGHLRAAEAQGWKTGAARALVDNWRNEYELTKGNEKTVMQFDMRPCLLSDSPLNLTALTLSATFPKLEEVLQEFGRSNSLTNTGFPLSAYVFFVLSLVLPLILAIAAGTILHSLLAGVVACFISFFFTYKFLVKLYDRIYPSSGDQR
jgi:hypothetical protein